MRSPRRLLSPFLVLFRHHFPPLFLSLFLSLALAAALLGPTPDARALDDPDLGTHGFADSGGVKIHYVTGGEGPLLVLLHGFPDFWYTWRAQMPALSKRFQVVAVDLRGYNESDKPEGVESYTLEKLAGDVEAVLKHFGREKAVIVGHDWGGAIAWTFAMRHPEKTDRLVILNLPHPRGLIRELMTNPEQHRNSQYARDFQKPDAASRLKPELLAMWVKDPGARAKYLEAFRKSSFEGMLNYYKANYPRVEGSDAAGQPAAKPLDAAPGGSPAAVPPAGPSPIPDYPPVKCPVLMIHGLKDTALLPGALNDTWKWVEGELTLVTIPGAGHFVQQDAAERVTRCMVKWLEE